MSLKDILKRLSPMRWQRVGKDEPVSIVLLLRQPQVFGTEELRLAAERAWHTSFAGDKGSMHFVMRSRRMILLKAGPHLLSILCYPEPYIGNRQEHVEWLSQESQRRAWLEHTGWAAVDYMNQDVDVDLAYCVLAKLVAEMLDENCTGMFMTRKRTMVPNDESLIGTLQTMASARESGVTPTTAS
jgi:hypothetical protein